jgi:hypothetical protein
MSTNCPKCNRPKVSPAGEPDNFCECEDKALNAVIAEAVDAWMTAGCPSNSPTALDGSQTPAGAAGWIDGWTGRGVSNADVQAELEARRDGLHVLNEFTKWHPDVEGIPCPIDTTEKHRAWLKKLAALCDRIAELETVLRRNAATFREIDDAAGRDATKMEAQKWKIQYLQDDLASARNQLDAVTKAKPPTHYYQQWQAAAELNSRLEAERDEARHALAQCKYQSEKRKEMLLRVARERNALRAELATERARREAAEAVVAKLPKTVDGVPIVPGIRLFPRADCELENEQGALVVEYAGIIIQDSVPSEYGNEELDVEEAGACFSTREAAQAALSPAPARPK